MAHSTYYTSTGKRVPSVTTVLNVLDAPGLKHWAWGCGQQGLHFDEVSRAAMWRGTLVHLACEMDDPTAALTLCSDEGERSTVLAGYSAYIKWIVESNVSIECKESKLVSDRYEFGGTLDMVAAVNGQRMIVDIKTGKGLYSTNVAQQAAYAVAWKEQHPDDPLWGVGLLHLRDGLYELKAWPRESLAPAWSTFTCALGAYNARKALEAMIR